jgi:hypothetical protein
MAGPPLRFDCPCIFNSLQRPKFGLFCAIGSGDTQQQGEGDQMNSGHKQRKNSTRERITTDGNSRSAVWGRLSTVILFTLLLLSFSSPALAQNARSHTDSASATLDISAYIVSVAYPKTENASGSTVKTPVLYSIPVPTTLGDSLEESKTVQILTNDGMVKACLRTTTVVPR